MFLDSNWAVLDEALRSENAEASRRAFLVERGTCMACHVAENMSFLNDTPIFRDTENFP